MGYDFLAATVALKNSLEHNSQYADERLHQRVLEFSCSIKENFRNAPKNSTARPLFCVAPGTAPLSSEALPAADAPVIASCLHGGAELTRQVRCDCNCTWRMVCCALTAWGGGEAGTKSRKACVSLKKCGLSDFLKAQLTF